MFSLVTGLSGLPVFLSKIRFTAIAGSAVSIRITVSFSYESVKDKRVQVNRQSLLLIALKSPIQRASERYGLPRTLSIRLICKTRRERSTTRRERCSAQTAKGNVV